ncbi:hypothetical protein [Geomesophilobacter sediminis]|uniref:Uncharacterized protein n=1 Tax=Geomesophilobacter sediminis TaxID=2798584 RepID=A0A8J7LZB3_9BACT|nr:hypothetical protein [Geomesophilobacter sediminis]MBJ6726106.1 hypothetical protein [Geomesophilobacter sediminis]
MNLAATGYLLLNWCAFLALYLLFAGEFNWSEAGAGAVFALLTTAAVAFLGKKFRDTLWAKPSWMRLLLRIPWAMLQETWLLVVALFRKLAGRAATGIFLQTVYPAPEDEHDSSRRAYMAFGVCITPNSYLVYHDVKSRKVLVRQLVGKELSEIDRKFVELP